MVAKSWRDGDPKAPIHEVDLKLVDFWGPRIAEALANLVSPALLRAAIEAAQAAAPVKKAANDVDPTAALGDASPLASPVTGEDGAAHAARKAAARAALGQGADSSAIEAVLRQTIADGWLAGGMAANRQLGIAVPNWDTWEPGDVDAAIADADGGLAALLDQAGIGVKGIVGDALDGLGNQIADGLLGGDDVDTVASSLSDWASGFRAERIAHTEIARAQDAATQGVYQANGIDEFDVILSDGACDECVDVAESGPYPAGDQQVPVHPYCRCASSPHIPDDWTAPAQDDGGDDTE